MRRRETRKMIFTLLFLLILGIGVGYSALLTSLSIDGTSTMIAGSWNIHFENLVLNNNNVALSTGDQAATIASATVTLQEPEALRNAILDTTVISGHGNHAGETNFTSTDKLYLLSTHEVWEAVDSSLDSNTAYSSTRQLDYYEGLNVTSRNYSGAIKKNGNDDATWFLRSSVSSYSDDYYRVINTGKWDPLASANSFNGVSPAFRLG